MITIYIGKSGAGKDTFLRKQLLCGVKPVVTYTTRPMRGGEVNGVDYNFVTEEEFLKLNEAGALIEYRAYNTLFNGEKAVWYYGSPKVDPSEDYVAVVDVSGAMSYIKAYGSENINIVYVYVDDDVRKERAIARGTFSETEWNRRLADDAVKFGFDAMRNLIRALGKPIIALDNNGNKPMFRKLGYL